MAHKSLFTPEQLKRIMNREGFFTEDEVEELRWEYISLNCFFDMEFAEKNADKIDWKTVANVYHPIDFDNNILLKFCESAYWKKIIYTLSQEEILNCKDKVDSYTFNDALIKNRDLPLSFIREFKENFHKFNWIEISKARELSEEFMRENKELLNWKYISFCQPLSKEFIEEFEDFLDLELVIDRIDRGWHKFFMTHRMSSKWRRLNVLD